MTADHYIYHLSDDLTLNIGKTKEHMYGELISKEEGTLTLIDSEITELKKALDEFQELILK